MVRKPVMEMRANYQTGVFEARIPKQPGTAVIDPGRWWPTTITVLTSHGNERNTKTVERKMRRKWPAYEPTWVDPIQSGEKPEMHPALAKRGSDE